MKVKTSELTGAALDWAVAKCERRDPVTIYGVLYECGDDGCNRHARYSIDWSQGGPIIERENINLYQDCPVGPKATLTPDVVRQPHFYFVAYGPTPLIAAMRCYAASKLGEEVEVPEELIP